MTTSVYSVTGMTCGHCVSAVTDEVGKLPGVSSVVVDLVPGDASTVTITGTVELSRDQVAEAVDEAGYSLVSP